MPVYNRMPKGLKMYKWEKYNTQHTEKYYINQYQNNGVFMQTIIEEDLPNPTNEYYYQFAVNNNENESKEFVRGNTTNSYVYSTNPLTYPPNSVQKDSDGIYYWYTILPESIDDGYSFYSVHNYLSYSYLQTSFLRKDASLIQYYIEHPQLEGTYYYKTGWGYFMIGDDKSYTMYYADNLITFYDSNDLIYGKDGNDFNGLQQDSGESYLSGGNIIAFDKIPLYFSTGKEGIINDYYNQIFINNSKTFKAESDTKDLGSLNTSKFIQYSSLPFHVSIKNPEGSGYQIYVKDETQSDGDQTLDPGEEHTCLDLNYNISIIGLELGRTEEYPLPLVKVKFVDTNNQMDGSDLRNTTYNHYKIITAENNYFNIPVETTTAYKNYNGEILDDKYDYYYNSFIPDSFIYIKDGALPTGTGHQFEKIII